MDSIRWRQIAYLTSFTLILLLMGCAPAPSPTAVSETISATTTPTTQITPATSPTQLPISQFVQVDEVTVETSRGQLQLIVQLTLPNRCHDIGPIEQSRRGRTLNVTIAHVVRNENNCDPQERTLEQIIDIDSIGLEVGFYAFNVNDLAGSFALDESLVGEMSTFIELEEVAQATLVYEATATAGAQATQAARVASGAAEIHGQIWHDFCLSNFTNTDLSIEPEDGCQRLNSGTIIGDGKQSETDEGLPFITVNLEEGACDNSTPFRTTLTSATGQFDFFDLPPNTYCLSVSNTDDNETLLAAGAWTTADPGTTYSQTITLQPRQIVADLSLGWDYATLPRADIAAGCINKGFLVFHINYPPGTVMRPRQTVEKGWRVQNIGTCTWDADYGIVRPASDGSVDPADIVLLDQVILPNETSDIVVTANLPQRAGRYSWIWLLVDAEQQPFDVGLANDAPLHFDFVIPAAATAVPTAITAETATPTP